MYILLHIDNESIVRVIRPKMVKRARQWRGVGFSGFLLLLRDNPERNEKYKKK